MNARHEGLNARQFLDEHGRDEARRIAELAGTNLAYFEQFACGARRPSIELAKKLVSASNDRLGFTALLLSKKPPVDPAPRATEQAGT
jgi:hypothetical protein